MKKLLFITLLGFSFNCFSQQWDGADDLTGGISRYGHIILKGNPDADNTNNSGDIIFRTSENGQLGRIWAKANGESGLFLSSGNNTPSIYIHESGKVGIGTGSNIPDSELSVNGKIHCEEVLVDANVSPDYVFQKYYTGKSDLKADYTMPTLEEIEVFTKKNHHLPEVPSASDIKENGLQLKEMTNLLLQKVEELTLYTIEQQKLINAQNQRIKALESKTN